MMLQAFPFTVRTGTESMRPADRLDALHDRIGRRSSSGRYSMAANVQKVQVRGCSLDTHSAGQSGLEFLMRGGAGCAKKGEGGGGWFDVVALYSFTCKQARKIVSETQVVFTDGCT
jgi:hypothetical protein